MASVSKSGIVIVFSAQQHITYMLSALYAIAHPSITRVDHTKTVEARIVKFHHTVAPSL